MGSDSVVLLDGYSLTLQDASRIAGGASVAIDERAKERVTAGRRLVEKVAAGEKPFYAINTGFGYYANTKISPENLRELQLNIVRSHSGGAGEPFSIRETRLAMALRLNLLIKGSSGVRFEVCEAFRQLLERGIHSVVPRNGSVGASGDLIPLAHMSLPLVGEGEVWYRGAIVPSAEALLAEGLQPLELAEKEGISLLNGTEFMQAVGGLALGEALRLLEVAERLLALTAEAFGGNVAAFDRRIHDARRQTGQIRSAERIREELRGSYLYDASHQPVRVQDPYSIRCAPQVHGAARDALGYARMVVERELNAITDNPIVFTEDGEILSGGNFHGEPLAMAFDFAAIAASELANISERRTELLSNPHMSGLPAFLSPNPGLDSGYMVLQYLAGSLVNENKVLSHPASTDSIPALVGIEDFVSMGMTSAKKFSKIVENLRTVLAAELLMAVQAIRMRGELQLGEGSRRAYRLASSRIDPLHADRIVAKDVEAALTVIDALMEEGGSPIAGE